MSTSGSTNFTVTRNQLIYGALRLCGVIAENETPSTEQINNASEALNMFVKRLEAEGMALWSTKEYNVPLTAGQNTYMIGIADDMDIKGIVCNMENGTVSMNMIGNSEDLCLFLCLHVVNLTTELCSQDEVSDRYHFMGL